MILASLIILTSSTLVLGDLRTDLLDVQLEPILESEARFYSYNATIYNATILAYVTGAVLFVGFSVLFVAFYLIGKFSAADRKNSDDYQDYQDFERYEY